MDFFDKIDNSVITDTFKQALGQQKQQLLDVLTSHQTNVFNVWPNGCPSQLLLSTCKCKVSSYYHSTQKNW